MISKDDKLFQIDIHKDVTSGIPRPMINYKKYDKTFDQDQMLLNSYIALKYRELFISDIKALDMEPTITRNGVKIPSRPYDDTPFTKRGIGPEDYEDPYVKTGTFLAIRADYAEADTDSHVLIGYDEISGRILINSSLPTDTGYEFEDKISNYGLVDEKAIGLWVDVFPKFIDDEYNRGVVIYCENTEPYSAIILEYLNEDYTVARLRLIDECVCRPIINNDGSYMRHPLFNDIHNDSEIRKARKTLLEGITIEEKQLVPPEVK